MSPAALLVLCAAAAAPQDLQGLLEERLRSPDDRDRQQAVTALSKLGSEEAWELVLGALTDPAPMVADEAQLAVARIPNGDVLALALGKQGLGSRDELVRERVAEGLGRATLELAPELFVKPLRDKAPDVRRALAWSIERRRIPATGKLAGSLADLYEDDRDAGVRAAGLLAMTAALDTDVALAAAAAALTDEASEVRAAAALLTRVGATEQALPHLVQLGQDPSVSVRRVVVEQLAARADAPSARALVDLLEAETSLQLRWRAVALLQGVSGKGYRLDTRPWRDWADALADDWSGEEAQREVDTGPATAALAGLPILSERVVFLIDMSGSIWKEVADGRTRKQLVDQELRTALEALDPEQRFNLIPYNERPIPWKKALVEASPANVKKALAWFEGRKDQGKGDLWEALLLAMQDPAVDTIVVLGDGAPSGGEHWNLGLMQDLFAERNRFRRVALDAVLTDPPGSIVKYWRQLTAVSGGRMLEISFEGR